MTNFKFETREEVMEFLAGYDFKYYVPRLKEPSQHEADLYYVELTKHGKIGYCARLYIENGAIYNSETFYEHHRVYDFDTADEGEARYLEGLELIGY